MLKPQYGALLVLIGNADLTYQGQARGNTYAGTTLHWGPFWPYNKYDMTSEWRLFYCYVVSLLNNNINESSRQLQ